ncbi:MAG: precorrin-6y C5,15-methyltransferase (decarboxylating) subunit CbiE [Prochlorococcus sp.]
MPASINPAAIHVIGTDATGLDHLAAPLQELVLSAQAVAAPTRLLQQLPSWWQQQQRDQPLPELIASDQPDALIAWLKQQQGIVVVLASGDPLWFGIGRRLLEALPADQLHFHPAPSSLQLAFARIGRPWQDASWISLHGRDPAPLAQRLQQRPTALAVLTDPSRGGAEEVRTILRASGLEASYAVWLCEQLGHANERVKRLTSQDELPSDLHPLHLVVLLAERDISPGDPAELTLFGIDDGIFLQHHDRPGLMTKKELRVQLLAELDLPEQGVLWDLGAGVGSVGLEALRLRPKLQLLAVEKRGGGTALIKANAARLAVQPTAVLETEALDLLNGTDLPPSLSHPNRVLLGGGGRQRAELLQAVLQRLQPNGVVVIPLATVEALAELRPLLEASSCTVKVSQHQAWRGLPLADGTRMAPMNPVIILKGTAP